MSPPQASRLQSRLDLYMRLRGIGPVVPLAFAGSSAPVGQRWSRNGPAQADTLSVDIVADMLPADLRILEGAAVDHWLFEHQTPEACVQGDPGYFSGQVDGWERKVDGDTNIVTLTARDWTALPIATKIAEADLAQFTIAEPTPLETIVSRLLSLMDARPTWQVQALEGKAAALAQTLVTPPKIVPAKSRKGRAKRGPQAVAKGPNLGQILPPGGTTVWAAVNEVCIRYGVTPEIRNGPDGRRVVILMATEDVQTSTALSPFERDGETQRLFVEGECSIPSEQGTLTTAAGLPDFVALASIDPVTGASIEARWPPADKAETKAKNGMFQTVDGVTDPKALEQMARDAWNARAHNQYRMRVSVPHPWSSGGGPGDPDLLGIAYGAGVAVQRRPPEIGRWARGVDARIVDQIMASLRTIRDHALLFQVAGVDHTNGEGGYECTLTLRQFLGLGRFDNFAPGGTDIYDRQEFA